MRLRHMALFAISAVAAVLAALAIGWLALSDGKRDPRPPHRDPPTAEFAQPTGDSDDFDVPMADLVPMHKAVRRAMQRFNGRVLDIELLPAGNNEKDAGISLIYRLRLVTPGRDILDIRMDALTGRFVDVRGLDLSAARRAPDKRRKKDDD